GVEELRVTQVLQLRSTELLGGLVLQVDRLEHAEWHRLELLVTALEREVDLRREQVDVLGPREVRQEGEDETQGAPPTDMPTQHPAVAEAHERSDRRGEGLPGVRMTLGREQERLGHEAETHVQDDEPAYDQRVAAHRPLAHLL